MNNQVTKAAVISCLIFFLVGVGLGAWGEYTWGPRLTDKHTVETVKEPVVNNITAKTGTEIQYVPKETIVYKDGTKAKESTDVQIGVAQPGVNVKVNGQPYQFSLLQGETQKFQDGKIVLSQNSSINFDVKVPTIDTTRRNGIGPYITTESWGAMVSRDTEWQRVTLMAGKKWDSKNGRSVEAGGAWQIKF